MKGKGKREKKKWQEPLGCSAVLTPVKEQEGRRWRRGISRLQSISESLNQANVESLNKNSYKRRLVLGGNGLSQALPCLVIGWE